jgi:glycosyltransferase involved in cell wall biosynthesis
MENISLFFPIYKDEATVEKVAQKALSILPTLSDEYEIIIVDDASPDRAGEIADQLALQHKCIRVIHHPKNLGYGSAIRSGLSACKYELICMIDGDDEYEVSDFINLMKVMRHYDLVITFRYKKLYSTNRQFISWVYNCLIRFLFRTHFRDISTGLRMARRSMIRDLELTSTSPFIGAEITIKAMLKGYAIGEVGIQTFPRNFGKGSSVTLRNIIATIRDLFRIHNVIFSDQYELPPNRERNN